MDATKRNNLANGPRSKFSIRLHHRQKGEISDLFLRKIIYVIKKVIKNYIQHVIMVTLISNVFVEL